MGSHRFETGERFFTIKKLLPAIDLIFRQWEVKHVTDDIIHAPPIYGIFITNFPSATNYPVSENWWSPKKKGWFFKNIFWPPELHRFDKISCTKMPLLLRHVFLSFHYFFFFFKFLFLCSIFLHLLPFSSSSFLSQTLPLPAATH